MHVIVSVGLKVISRFIFQACERECRSQCTTCSRLKHEISHLKGKITKLKCKLANNQEQWVQTFQQIQEQNRLLMVNTGKASNLLQHDAVFLRTYDNILDHTGS